MIETIVTSVLSSGLLTGLLIWIFKTWISEKLKCSIQYEYDLLLTTHKSELEATNQLHLEKIRIELQNSQIEYKIRYEQLQYRIAHIMGTLYAKLATLYRDVTEYMRDTTGTIQRKDSVDKVNNSFEAFQNYYLSHKIYLPSELATEIDSCYEKIGKNAFLFSWHINNEYSKNDPTEFFRQLVEDMPPVLQSLENKFREQVRPISPDMKE